MNYLPGLVSISFRSLSPSEIVALVAEAGLVSIEWGGDVHVPPGDLDRAREVRAMTEEAGLTTAAYGSYFRCTAEEEFAPVLESALALGAPLIRVWAGRLGSAEADASQRAQVAERLREISAAAEKAGVVITTEFHAGTLTDTADSLLELFREVDHPNLRTYWQPSVDRPEAVCLEEIAKVGPWLTHLHAYYWNPGATRRPLAGGEASWRKYLAAAKNFPGERHCLLEFVEDNDPAALLRDAETLKSWLANAEG